MPSRHPIPPGLLVCAILLSCSTARPEPAAETTVPAREVGPTPAREQRLRQMHAELGVAREARDAVIAGELEQARQPLIWLASNQLAVGIPAEWQIFVQRLQAAAAKGSAARDVSEMATAVATVAATCGGCHSNASRGPLFFHTPVGEVPSGAAERDDAFELRARMHQHAWIAERLWQGLIGPWDGAWKVGCDELRALQADPAFSELMQARLASFQTLASSCASADLGLRAQSYARVIASCGECHTALGVRARPTGARASDALRR